MPSPAGIIQSGYSSSKELYLSGPSIKLEANIGPLADLPWGDWTDSGQHNGVLQLYLITP